MVKDDICGGMRKGDSIMSSTVINLEGYTQESLTSVADKIESFNSGSDLVLRQIKETSDSEVLLMVFEKYYFRNGSMAVLTVEIISDGETQNATVIGTGGGGGILNISWGANSEYADDTAVLLQSLGFKTISERVV